MIKMEKVVEKSDCPNSGHTYVQWMLAVLVNTTLLTYGLQTGWISPVTTLLQSSSSPTGPLSDNEISWVASTLSLSAAIGVPLYSYVTDKYGRKVGVMAIIIPQAICWLIKILSTNVATLIVARVFGGLAAGGCFNVIPIYVKEISQDDNRGLLGSLLIMFQNIGIFLIYLIGAYIDYYTVLWAVLALPVVTALMMVKAPESPAFLVKVGRDDEAASVIALLRGLQVDDKAVENELHSLKTEDAYFKSIPEASLRSIFAHKPWRRSTILMASIIFITACNGCFSIITYASFILSSSGVTFSPELQSLSFPIVMILAAFVSMACIEKFGRKALEAVTCGITALCFLGLAVIIHLQTYSIYVPGWMSVLCMVVALACYAAGTCPVPYIMMSEMFNFQIRAKAFGTIVTFAWSATFLQLIIFGPISTAVGIHNTFYFFAAFNLFATVIVLVFLPETKGKTVEEIELELSR